MSLLPVRFLAAARQELRRAVEHYDRQVSGLGDQFAAQVERSAGEIAGFPEIGSPYLAGTRRVSTHRFPYSLVYRVLPDQIVIVAVAHHRRRPGYWHRRA